MAQERVSGPQSSAGIVQFVNDMSGGPQMDPRSVIIAFVAIIFMIKIISMLTTGA